MRAPEEQRRRQQARDAEAFGECDSDGWRDAASDGETERDPSAPSLHALGQLVAGAVAVALIALALLVAAGTLGWLLRA